MTVEMKILVVFILFIISDSVLLWRTKILERHIDNLEKRMRPLWVKDYPGKVNDADFILYDLKPDTLTIHDDPDQENKE